MNRILLFILVAAVSVFLSSCSEHAVTPSDGAATAALITKAELGRACNTFGFDLFKEIVKAQPDSNVVISPLSISLCLGMAQNGAAGSTLEAMLSTLGLSGYTPESANECYRDLTDYLMALDLWVQCDIANSIWYRDCWTLKEKFRHDCQAYFDARVEVLDFNRSDAADIMNRWVDEQTLGRIPEIVEAPIPLDIQIILLNAVYFNAFWTHKFNRSSTSDAWFNLPGGGKRRCRMMMQPEGHFYKAVEGPGFYGMDLAYGDSIFSMTVLLPKHGVHVDSVIANLTQENWEAWTAGLKPWYGELHMPKFELECFVQLSRFLAAMGMAEAFDKDADFSRMFEEIGIWLDYVKHKTYIRVDEEGTEAAAVTEAGGATGIPKMIYIDRPFVFAIRENRANNILFIGKVADPGYLE